MKSKQSKTLYIWDAADTVFVEDFRKELGSANIVEHLSKIVGGDATKFNDWEYSKLEDQEFKKGVFYIDVKPGFRKLLSYTKNNLIVSSGNPSQTEYRRKLILKKHGFDIMDYISEVTSIFDWNDDPHDGSRNPKMFVNLMGKKLKEGFTEFVYADDKLKNCLNAYKAYQKLKTKYPDIKIRIYHIGNNDLGLVKKKIHYQVANLYDLMEEEKNNGLLNGG